MSRNSWIILFNQIYVDRFPDSRITNECMNNNDNKTDKKKRKFSVVVWK